MMKLLSTILLLSAIANGANAFSANLGRTRLPPPKAGLYMTNVGVFFGTSTGSTETVADMLVEKLGADGPFDVDDGDSIVETFQNYDALIVGTPTWNTGADIERSGTGWDELYYGAMEGITTLKGKKVAVFGLGDSVSYAENFSDAAGELHDVFEKLGCQMFGYTSTEGYLHEDSKSIRGDKFCALLLDMVNQEDLTEERVDNWIAQLTQEGFLLEDDAAPNGSTASVMDVMQEATTPATTTVTAAASLLTPDSFFAHDSQPTAASSTSMDEMVARLQRENALLKQQLLAEEQERQDSAATVLKQLEDDSALLDQNIATHNSGYTPHTNPATGKTMWTSPDGRTCYFTDAGTTTTAATAATGITP